MADDSQIKLTNVRLSFPDIWRAKAVQEGSEPKYGAHFLLEKEEHAELIKQLKAGIWALAKGKFGDKAKDMIQKNKLHICLHEGNEKDYDGYNEGNMFVSTSSSKRPLIIDRDKSALAEDDRRPYAGCYVNGVVRLWVQDNQFGKRVNAELMGIQFVADGEPFGAAPLSPDAFEDLDAGKGGKAKPKTGEPAEPAGEEPDDDDNIPF